MLESLWVTQIRPKFCSHGRKQLAPTVTDEFRLGVERSIHEVAVTIEKYPLHLMTVLTSLFEGSVQAALFRQSLQLCAA